MPRKIRAVAMAAACAGASALAIPAHGLMAAPLPTSCLPLRPTMMDLVCDEDECELPPPGVMMNDVMVTADTLRAMDLADPTGTRRMCGEFLGDEKSVVVFLRHLG